MDEALFESRSSAWLAHRHVSAADIPYGRGVWQSSVATPTDEALDELADLLIASRDDQRSRLSQSVGTNAHLLWNLVVYVRRSALRMDPAHGARALERALSLAVFVGGREDLRDLIVSLVILRVGAERAGLDHKPSFDKAARMDPVTTGVFLNARNHAPADVASVLAHYGPPQWKRAV